MMGATESAHQRPDQQHDQYQEADRDVGHVDAGENEEGRAIGVGRKHERFASPLEALDGDKNRAQDDRTGQRQNEPALVLLALESLQSPGKQETAGDQDDRIGNSKL